MIKQGYINRILLIMNEAGMIDSQGLSMVGADITQVDRYIEGSYIDAWRICVKAMPRNWFVNKTFKSNTHTPNLGDGTGIIKLPADYYLLTQFKMQGWAKSVYEASIETDHVASIQANEYTRGSQLQPVCVISTNNATDNSIQNVLKYYSLPRGLTAHVIEQAVYVPIPKQLKDVGINEDLGINEQVAEPLCYLGASIVLTMFEKFNLAKELEARALAMIPGSVTLRGKITTTKQ